MYMQPASPSPAPPPIVPQPSGQPQYDFIFNAPVPSKSVLPGGGSKKGRIILVVAGIVGLLLVIVLVGSLLFGGNGNSATSLTAIAQQQSELIRISEIGDKKARGTDAQNLATTTKLSLKSDQASLLASMGRQKPAVKELALGKNVQTDLALTQAEQSNRFDEVFIQTVQSQLSSYRQNVKKAYDETTSKKTKDLLAKQYKNALTLAPVR